jgi:hypothetical protein
MLNVMGVTMKKTILATAIALCATAAIAGTPADPIVTSVVIEAEAASSTSHDFLVPLFFLLYMGIALL